MTPHPSSLTAPIPNASVPLLATNTPSAQASMNATLLPPVPTRALQYVLTHVEHICIVTWMVDAASTDGAKNIASRALRGFSVLFRGNAKANSGKANRLWVTPEEFLSYSRSLDNRGILLSITRVTRVEFKRVYIKVRTGRGRKTCRLG